MGIDYSEDMIHKAEASYPDISFQICDITTAAGEIGTYDIIFSNACLQWVPDHRQLIPMLFHKLSKHGILAVQMPMNGQEALFQIMDQVLSEPQCTLHSYQGELRKGQAILL